MAQLQDSQQNSLLFLPVYNNRMTVCVYVLKSSQFYLYHPISQITHLPQGILQSVLTKPTILRNPSPSQKMEGTSGRATEEGPLSQDRQTYNRCHVYRIDQYSKITVWTIIDKLSTFMKNGVTKQTGPEPHDLPSTMET